MSRTNSTLMPLKLVAVLFTFTLLWGCSSGDNSNNENVLLPVDPVTPVDPVDPVDPDFPSYTVVSLEPGDDLEKRALEALINAKPNTIVQLPAGTYDFMDSLSSSVDNIVLRGTGMGSESGTVLSFANSTSGAEGIRATGNNFVVQDLAIENTSGDAIKVKDANGVTFRRVRVEWTSGPDENNGAYGLYPVGCRNVLIEDTIVRGASDAGVYVGQSENIIVRRNYVYENVAGIEIENSKFADVYDNNTTGNTGGILVFDLPGPPVQGGEATRVFNNLMVDNNEPNFAPKGNIVGIVPTGTGLLIMANDDIEVFGNTISGNQSDGISIASYYINDVDISKAGYDPVPEKIYIHDNEIINNGTDPQGLAAAIKTLVLDGNDDVIDVFYDNSGVGTNYGLLVEFPDGFTENQRICIVNNTPGITLWQGNASAIFKNYPESEWALSSDPENLNCTHASLPPIELEPPIDPSNPDGPNPLELCDVTGDDRNVDAYVADCPKLSDYRLFKDSTNPKSGAQGGIIYDLNTPLFTDYANKYRFVFIPEGTTAAYRNQEAFDFPVGTIIAKTFTIQSDLRLGNSAQELIETRLLMRRKEGWRALPYIWNADKSDAILSVSGGTQNVNWVDIHGVAQSTNYKVPNTNDCANCHGEKNLIPIGPKARSLNKNYAYEGGIQNQLVHWAEQGVLTGAPTDTSSIDTIPLWGDTGASLNDRARGYLDVNCAHCHQPLIGAADTSGLYLEYDRPFGTETGLCKPPVAAGAGAGDLDYDIVPGNAAASIMDFRMDSNKLGVQMPEIGRSIIHTEGVQLIRDWINAMDPVGCSKR